MPEVLGAARHFGIGRDQEKRPSHIGFRILSTREPDVPASWMSDPGDYIDLACEVAAVVSTPGDALGREGRTTMTTRDEVCKATQRQREWDMLSERARQVTDWCGTPIDPGILETIVALWANGIGTHTSCEGHVDSGAFPYVMLTVASLEEQEEPAPRTEAGRKNLDLQARLLSLLEEFYSERRVPVHQMLVVADRPDAHGFYLQSQGGYANWLREGAERDRHLALYRSEMTRFTEFLKERFFAAASEIQPA